MTKASHVYVVLLDRPQGVVHYSEVLFGEVAGILLLMNTGVKRKEKYKIPIE